MLPLGLIRELDVTERELRVNIYMRNNVRLDTLLSLWCFRFNFGRIILNFLLCLLCRMLFAIVNVTLAMLR